MGWRWISIAALLAALVVGFGVLSKRGSDTTVVEATAQQPAYYLKDAVITETLPDGSPKYRLIANSIEQQSENESISLKTVRLEYFKVPDKRWLLSSDRGFVPAQSRTIQFLGDVDLRPLDGPAATFLKTEELTVDTDKNLAYTTTSPVVMRFGGYSMTVRRFEADLNTEKVRMESVHGRSEAS
jgi:LPS export ABC transporter protein LptC